MCYFILGGMVSRSDHGVQLDPCSLGEPTNPCPQFLWSQFCRCVSKDRLPPNLMINPHFPTKMILSWAHTYTYIYTHNYTMVYRILRIIHTFLKNPTKMTWKLNNSKHRMKDDERIVATRFWAFKALKLPSTWHCIAGWREVEEAMDSKVIHSSQPDLVRMSWMPSRLWCIWP